jgi:ABC-type Fe3+/spermidine/putrescine transport system ATPase subunit
MKEILRIAGLGQAFNGTTVLKGVNLSLDRGERLAVIGSSGSGKTTLLRLIAGLEAPAEGDIAIDGKPVSRAGQVLVAPEHREVALVFQGLALFPHLRALDQIAFAARRRGGIKQARSLLDRIGLGHRATAQLDELSGGERQRIALARALAQEPKLILMDEPFASLDDEKRAEMRDLLRSLLESTDTTLILVTHSRDDALNLARRTLVLERGRPVAQDLLETVMAHPRHIAAVRALGLGQVVNGKFTAQGDVLTAFGKIATSAPALSGPARLLVRPAQPRIVSNGDGVEAEVVSLELRPPDAREVRRIAVVRVAGSLLRVFVREGSVFTGDRVRVQIDGTCDPIEEERDPAVDKHS